ncbi:MAG: hypothetical protein KAT34_14675 [Candidatus Aminicenantes bacterium]|nr:hypothetical protein [Candidatus Aminicenantes bacterium]
MKRKLIPAAAVAVIILFTAGAIQAKDWKKADFTNLEGENRTFYVSSIQLVVNIADFQKTLDDELGFLLKNRNNTIPASIPIGDLKKSIEDKFGIIVDKSDYARSYEDRMKDGFFSKEPNYQGTMAFFNWEIPNQKNRVAISIYLFKIGNRIRKNKAQITIQLLQYNEQKSVYNAISTYKSKRVNWKKQTAIYEIIKTNCLVK